MAQHEGAAAPPDLFDLEDLLVTAHAARTITDYAAGTEVFAQGDAAREVCYLERGSVRLSVLSRRGKEAIVALLGPHDFFGEGCLAGQTRRMSTALAVGPSVVVHVAADQMRKALGAEPALADRFLKHMLARMIRTEADLIDQLFNSTEKRLARALLLLARFDSDDQQRILLPRLSQETLAEMVGASRSRVNFFLNKFRDLGFIEYNGEIKVHSSLLSIVLHD